MKMGTNILDKYFKVKDMEKEYIIFKIAKFTKVSFLKIKLVVMAFIDIIISILLKEIGLIIKNMGRGKFY